MNFRRRSGYPAALAAAAVTLYWYLPALNHDFVNWDDNRYVTENTHLSPFGVAFFRWAFFSSSEVMWHPLTWISHALDVAVWGLGPFGHHLTSVVLHALNTLLVGVLVQRLLEAHAGPERSDGHSRIIAALIASLLFGLHPIHVESVAWISERKDVLSACFYLATLLAYLRYLDCLRGEGRPGRSRSPGARYLLTLGWFVLALLSKPMVVTLPLALLIVDWHPMGRFANAGETRRALLEKIPFFFLSALALVIAYERSYLGGVAQAAIAAPLDRVLLAGHAIVSYLLKLVWPANLSPLYLHPQDVSIASSRFLVPMVAVIAITAGCIGSAKRNPVFAAVWAAFLATLLPVLGFVRIGPHLVADRYAYLSSIGPFLLCGLGAAWCWGRLPAVRLAGGALRFAAAAACAAAFGVLAMLTTRQIAVWKDSIVLWEAVIARNPDGRANGPAPRAASDTAGNYLAHTNLGLALAAGGRVDEAVEHFRAAIAIWPADARAHYNLADILAARGRLDEAVGHYRRAIEADPTFFQARNNLGVTLVTAGDLAAAEVEYRETLRLKPDDAIARFNLAKLLARTSRDREAALEFREVLRLRPDDAEALARLDALERAAPR